MLATSRQNQFHFKWNVIGELFRNMLIGKKYWRWMLQRQEMRNVKVSFNTKRHSVFPVLENLTREKKIFKMLCTFETLIHWAESQWHLNKDPNCSPLGPLWKFGSLHLQMPPSLATPASTSMSQGEERQKSLPSSGAFYMPVAMAQRHWGFSGVSASWAWGAALRLHRAMLHSLAVAQLHVKENVSKCLQCRAMLPTRL